MQHPLLFRRQFILSSSPEFGFAAWNNIKLNDSAYLSVHPDLEVVQSYNNNICLTFLGFIIDPFSPDRSNKEILDDILTNAKSFDDIVAHTNALGGRWIILYQDDNSFKVFHDPCGSRTVFYTRNQRAFLCGSDPAIISHFIKPEIDNFKEVQEFINSPNFRYEEHSWIGPDTIYLDVKHLMPNRYLDINKWETIRYWPNKTIEKMDLVQGAEQAAEILKGSILAASKRQPLVLAVTAGWDSRVLLAASKEVRKDITYFVSVPESETRNISDVAIPSSLFKDLNMHFEVQRCKEVDDMEFTSYFKRNVTLSRADIAKFKYIYRYYLDFRGKLNINGNVNEIARTAIRPVLPVKICGHKLAKLNLIGYSNISYVTSQLDLWIKDVRRYCDDYGLNIFDMLYWEQRMGNWGALYPAEQDIAMEQFSPFNNRLLLTTMLSVEEKYRIYPDYTLYVKMIKKLWPEVLNQPIGPESFKETARHMVKYSVMKLTGVY